jgi:hypothetical protein
MTAMRGSTALLSLLQAVKPSFLGGGSTFGRRRELDQKNQPMKTWVYGESPFKRMALHQRRVPGGGSKQRMRHRSSPAERRP